MDVLLCEDVADFFNEHEHDRVEQGLLRAALELGHFDREFNRVVYQVLEDH